MMSDLTQLLKRVSLFRGLTTDQLEQVATLTHSEFFKPHDTIFTQGAPGTTMYLIGKGQVEIRVSDIKGQTHSALILGEGQVFGEMALLDQGTRSATVVALDDETLLYEIKEPDFTALCIADTAIGYRMMRNLALDLSFKIRHQNFDY